MVWYMLFRNSFSRIYHVEHFDDLVWDQKSDARIKRGACASEIVGDIFGAMIPSVEVILNDLKIRMLSMIVDKFSTDTEGAFSLVDTEMAAIRSMVSQNCLALDILLAKEVGVCKMLKVQQCCTFIPDNSKELRKYIKAMTDLKEDLKELEATGPWDAIGSVFSAVDM